MAQQVNLFDSGLRPPRQWFTTVHLLAFFLVQLLVLGAVQGRERMALDAARQALLTLRIQEAVQKKKNEESILLYPPKRPDLQLSQAIELTRAKVDLHGRLAKKLSETTQGARGKGFAGHLEGLSRQHEPGLWLTRFSFTQGGATLALEGGVTEHQLLPRYLEKLGRERAFNGKTFKTFHMSRPGGEEKDDGGEGGALAKEEEAGILFRLHTDWIAPEEKKDEKERREKAVEKTR